MTPIKASDISPTDLAAIQSAEPSERSKALDHLMVENTSGFEPLDLRVLVLPDAVEVKTAGGILLPDMTGEREKYAMMFGTLVAVGENAWEEACARSAKFARPQVGERVVYAKYGGIEIKGRDGKQYRLMNDEDIIGRVIQ